MDKLLASRLVRREFLFFLPLTIFIESAYVQLLKGQKSRTNSIKNVSKISTTAFTILGKRDIIMGRRKSI